LLNPKVGFDPVRDFTPVAVVAAIPSVLVVHPLVPAKSIKDLVALARRNPDKLSYGSGGVGSTPHLASELLKSLAGIRMLHVPYKSATIALTGAMVGEVDVVVVASSSAAPYVKNGRLRALAVLDGKRVGSMPDVPTRSQLVCGARAARHAGGDRRAAQCRIGEGDERAGDARTPRRDRRRTHVHHARAGRRVHPRRDDALGRGHPQRRHQGRLTRISVAGKPCLTRVLGRGTEMRVRHGF
jgi:hypothetical protein